MPSKVTSWDCSQCGANNPPDVVQCKCGALNYGRGFDEEAPSKRSKSGFDQPPAPLPAGAPPPLPSGDAFPFALVGKTVVIHGLEQKPELNGMRGTVKEFDPDTGRYTVAASGGRGDFRLRRENMRERSSGFSAAVSAPVSIPQWAGPMDTAFIGKPIEVQGLDEASGLMELNGSRGVVTGFHDSVGRFTIEIENGRGQYNLVRDNLGSVSSAVAQKMLPPGSAPENAGNTAVMKRQICIYFTSGTCAKGKDCTFAHGEHELNTAINPGGPTLHPEGSYIMGYNRMVIKTINIPSIHKGAIIGSGGKAIHKIRQDTGAHASLGTHPDDPDLAVITFRGTWEQIDQAEKVVQANLDVLKEQEKNKIIVKTTNIRKKDKGAIIGAKGKRINAIRQDTGAFCSVDPHPTDENLAVLSFRGIYWQIDAAEQMIRNALYEQGITPGFEPVCEIKPPTMKDPVTGKDVFVCTFWMKGSCKHGDKCNRAHIQPPPSAKEMCPFFLDGFCSWGDKCNKSHDGTSGSAGGGGGGASGTWLPPGAQQEPGKEVCRMFMEGSCQLGTDCMFVHQGKPAITGGPVAPVQPPKKQEVCLLFQKGYCILGDQCKNIHCTADEVEMHTLILKSGGDASGSSGGGKDAWGGGKDSWSGSRKSWDSGGGGGGNSWSGGGGGGSWSGGKSW